MRRISWDLGSVVLFALLVAVLVPAMADAYWTLTSISAVIFAVAALGVAVLYGQLGLVSLCQVGLVGIGGWVALRLGYATELPFLVLVALAGLTTMVIGTLVGTPALRLTGLYLALLTLMAAGGAQVLFSATGFPNGGPGFLGNGATGGQQPLARPGLAESDGAYLRLCVGVAVVMFAIVAVHLRTAPGRAWAAIRQSEAAAQSLGINTTTYKLWAFALSSLLAGVAGALLAGSIGTLDVALFRSGDSVVLFAVVLVGGAFGLEGAVLAGLFAKVLPAALDRLGVDADVALVLFGGGVLHVLIFAPEGLAGLIERLRHSAAPSSGTPTEVAR
ncbi:MAG: branched-chain amino acid transporter permease [Conexibacter sp.]|nr:branched-chain amino acid transporter permease [Conexibacter sp.]